MPDETAIRSENRVVDFRDAAARRAEAERLKHEAAASPVADLKKFQHVPEPDDYRHRMITNVAALVFVVLLVIGGVWIADTLATMRKNQDCVLSGRRGCTPVDVPISPRW